MFLLGSVVGVAVGCGRAVASEVIEIFEHNGEYSLDAPPADRPPLALLIPEEFRYGGSKGKTTAWGVNLLTYYPRMTSQLAPENADFGLACRGDCNGRILISVENVAHGRGAITGMGDVIAHSLIPRFLHIGGASQRHCRRNMVSTAVIKWTYREAAESRHEAIFICSILDRTKLTTICLPNAMLTNLRELAICISLRNAVLQYI